MESGETQRASRWLLLWVNQAMCWCLSRGLGARTAQGFAATTIAAAAAAATTTTSTVTTTNNKVLLF